ncbi:hypothetical protein B0J13DRAFT_631149 [Dactylonectria estremocensis]|uniref:Uncharacterized protein n=1 Tax=Dactylonectria estremocensis TaxID=1079267 RepID=A0A9P9D7A4_9HYPO|nr:hypothetical protein B0J13DRAFT_631149 [Dactylonectria estremocensis]
MTTEDDPFFPGVSNEETDRLLQTFPDQRATGAAKATISEPFMGHQPAIAFAPKVPLQPLPIPSLSPVKTEQVVLVSHAPQENNTRNVDDAAVGIKRDTKKSGPWISGEPKEFHSTH